MKILILALLLGISLQFNIQSQTRLLCGTSDHMKSLISADSAWIISTHALEASLKSLRKSNAVTDNTVIDIPVVVHVVYKTDDENLSKVQIQSQITILNQDFRRMSGTPGYGNGVDTYIQFHLATTDPFGHPTDGIEQVQTNTDSFGENDDVKFTSKGGADAWDRNAYLNIWVCNLVAQNSDLASVRGYTQNPDYSPWFYTHPANTDGVVIKYTVFGLISTTDTVIKDHYDKGRTTTHEVGHWLGLIHPWGDVNDCFGTDYCADTRTCAGYYCYGETGSTDLVQDCTGQNRQLENYMEYSDDRYLNTFTSDQTARMRDVLKVARPTIGQRSITFYQVFSSLRDVPATMTVWDGSDFWPKSAMAVHDNDNIVLRADTAVEKDKLVTIQNHKFAYWTINSTKVNDVSNYQLFTVQPNDKSYSAIFNPLVLIKFDNLLLETGKDVSSSKIEFADPWLRDRSNSNYPKYLNNRGTNALFIPQGVPFTPDLGNPYPPINGYIYQSILLNQNNKLYPDQATYAINSPDQVYSVGGINHGLLFLNWSCSQPTKVNFENSNAARTRVVFLDDNLTITANLKGSQLSNNPNSFLNSSQRKVVVSTYNNITYFHMVYESMGMIWYEISTDNGASWKLANNNLPLSLHGKLPSIDYSLDGGKVCIAWVEKQTNSDDPSVPVNILMNIFTASGSPICGSAYNQITYQNLHLKNSINPVVAFNADNHILVCWMINNSDYPTYPTNCNGIYCWYGSFNNNYFSFAPIYTSSTPIISCSSPNNITISGNKNYDGNCSKYFEFAWEENTKIHYCQLYGDGFSGIVQYYNSAIPSDGTGFTNNTNPSIIAIKQLDNSGHYISGSRLTWIGTRTTYGGGGGGGSSKIMTGGTIEQKAVFMDPSILSRVWSFSNNVYKSVINQSPDCYSIAWSKSNTDPIQFTDSHTLQTITTLDGLQGRPLLKGVDLQLSNGDHDYLMRAVSFNSATTPFSFNNNYLYTRVPQKIEQYVINNGREGIVRKDSCEFYFGIGDIKADNKIIEFTPISDTTQFQTLAELNSYLVTKPIQINNNSELLYSVQYGITDSVAATNALKGNGHINFKVEILDAVTDEVLGESDNVNFDSLHIFEYDNIAYQVNTNGIGNRTIKLRLKITTNSNIEYSLKNSYSTDEIILQKSRTNQRVVLNLSKVTSYELNQNYPNPFNPTTTIKYQIPKAGMVTLKVYDILGKEVASLIDEFKNQGRYSINFNASKLASGVYIYQIKSNDYVSSKKMMLIK
jgi:hypothetical protein